jgi:molybdopterin converting factor small subunit
LKVTVKFPAKAREITGAREETLAIEHSATVLDILRILVAKHGDRLNEYLFDPESGNPRQHLRFLLNGQSVSASDGFPSIDSVLLIFPPTSGG